MVGVEGHGTTLLAFSGADEGAPLAEMCASCVQVSEIEVAIAAEATADLLGALHDLVPQLSSSATPLTMAELEAIIAHDATHLLIASDGASIAGCLTLAVFPTPTGVRAWIEDVVVDERARGKGVGELLNRFALDLARRLGARTVDLTSRPSREAANRLYQRIGFQPRSTNIYRYDLNTQ